jgi:hypothetical protein
MSTFTFSDERDQRNGFLRLRDDGWVCDGIDSELAV